MCADNSTEEHRYSEDDAELVIDDAVIREDERLAIGYLPRST
jgi:hypothetical protein